MPTLAASYFAESAHFGDTTTLSTPSFTPANGEVIVVKAATWDSGTPSGTPSGGGLVYTQRATAAPGGFNGYATIFTTVVSGSPGSMSVTLSAPGSSANHSMVVERWTTAQLAGSPATSAPINGFGGPPSASITTTGANSIITWVAVDVGSADPTSRAYLSSATEDGLSDGHVGSNSVHYYAYQTAAVAGSQTLGMSAPSQTWVMAGIEVKAAAVVASPSAFLAFFE
jgi:hypothetical protein